MEWYSFEPTTDEKICGAYMQTDGMGPGYDLRAVHSVWNIPNLKRPNFEPNFDCFRLDRKAKATDVISTGIINACGFIVSDKLKVIFDNHKLPPHIYYSVVIVHKKEKLNNYYWLHFTEDNTKDIDFGKSEFIRRDPLLEADFEKIYINNELELIKEWKRESIKVIYPTLLSLHEISDDIIILDKLGTRYYVSKKLYHVLKDNSIGFDYFDLPFKIKQA